MKKVGKNKKGFTLIELLGVIVLLGIIALISVPVINDKIEEAKEKSYASQTTNILDAAKKYASSEIIGFTVTKRYNYDIIFVLDDSSSMNGDCTDPNKANSLNRLKNSVSAVNEIMQRYMADSNNRVGIITFHGTVSTLLPLDHYSSTTGDYIETIASNTELSDPYYASPTCSTPASEADDRVGPFYNVHRKYRIVPGVTNSKGEEVSSTIYNTGGHTNAQEALYRGMQLLIDNPSTNVPIVFFITDGVVGYNVHTSYITPDDDHLGDSTDAVLNMYNTVLTAMYYKNYIYNLQGRMPKIYSVGLEIVGDREKAYLFPNEKNLSSTNSNVKRFKSLLESDDNPFKNNYQYIENSFIGKNLSDDEIKESIGNSIEESTEVYEVTLDELIESGYLTSDAKINPKTNEELQGYVSIKYVRHDDKTIICDSNESTKNCGYVYEFIDTTVSDEE